MAEILLVADSAICDELRVLKVLNWVFSSTQDEAWDVLAVPGRHLLLQRLFLLTETQTTAIEPCQGCDEVFSSADTKARSRSNIKR